MYNQRKPHSIYHDRDGVTLLFVISLVVLFLLMGTTFVVVSNDYFKAARRRSRLATNVVDNEALLDRAFYQLMREVPLADSSSPLRGHSILADQYGYGIKSQVAVVPTVVAGPFVDITISANGIDNTVFSRIRIPGSALLLRSDSEYFDGAFNGQVFSITSGALRDVSTRIINTELILGSNTDGSLDQLTITIPKGAFNWSQLAVGDGVLINGKDFGGAGAGDVDAVNFNSNSYDDVVATEVLGINSLTVNQQGVPFNTDDYIASGYTGDTNATFINITTDASGSAEPLKGFVAIDNSINESYDIPDFQNMFLSGTIDSATPSTVPSFHRDSLYSNRVTSAASPLFLRQFTLRPVYVADSSADDGTALHSTANADFFNTYLSGHLNADGTPIAGTDNNLANLDVDSDGDGALDSVWIDIGLPTQVDAEGVRFRPLVAYRVVDMDGRLNVNAHGSAVDALLSTSDNNRLGSGYGVADISLSGVVASTTAYTDLIDTRSPQITASTDDERFGPDQLLFGFARGSTVDGNPSTLFGSFGTGSNLAGQYTVGSDAADINAMPGLVPKVGFEDLPAGIDDIPYDKDFRLAGGTGSSFFEPWELEALLRPFDNDRNLTSSRLLTLIGNGNAVTTDSFEVNVPAVSIPPARRLNRILLDNNITTLAARSTQIAALLPRDLRLGGKLNINRPLGNGIDDGGVPGAVDDSAEVGAANERSDQSDTPVMNLDNNYLDTGNNNNSTGDELARHLLAKDIYITFMIACGDRAPAEFANTLPGPEYSEDFATFTGAGGENFTTAITSADYEYRKMVAQFAVNVVDFKDPDSIMTPFEFDIEPFDAAGWEVDGDVTTAGGEMDRFVVWGAERPELLLTETFAFHDRQTRDTATDASGMLVADGDLDWDTVNAPISSAAFEIYNPWYSSTSSSQPPMYQSPDELGGPNSINLAAQGPSNSPVWRIALKRERSDKDVTADIVRTIYFSDPTSLPASAGTEEKFYPSGGAGLIEPGAYVSLMPPTDPTIDSQVLTASTAQSSSGINARVVRVDTPRPLSVSDANGGYIDPVDGMARAGGAPFTMPLDSPPGVASEDLDAIHTAGIADNFRYAYLQRLADPSLAFDPDTNPYRTIDSMTVDLLAGNSLVGNVGDVSGEQYVDDDGAQDNIINQNYALISTERGEIFASADVARRNLFASEDGEKDDDATETIPATVFTHTFGELNTSYSGTVPFGSLTWNDRPFASAGEIANVPYLPSGLMTYFFNEGARPHKFIDADMRLYYQNLMPYFGEVRSNPSTADDGHRHLLRFGAPLGITMDVMTEVVSSSNPNVAVMATTDLTANRFARLFDYIETPSLYLGNETFISSNGATTGGTYPINFYPPFHFIPEFRTPGKVNINTISDNVVWTAVNGGNTTLGFSPLNFNTGTSLHSLRDVQTGPTDFAGFLSSAEGRSLVPGTASDMVPEKGSVGTPFGIDMTTGEASFDGRDDATHDIAGTPYFRNEVRQRLTNLTTTRSSVFSIWITIGYFEIDDQGRIGLEVGSDTGETRRNRAFFMIDRSIPVAFEPGRNHNIEKTILTRTIIE